MTAAVIHISQSWRNEMTDTRTNAELAKLAIEHYDAELDELCRRDSELNRLRAAYAYLAQEADEDYNPLQPTGEDYVPLHRRPGPLSEAYLAYRARLKQIAELMVVFPQYNYESDAYRVAVALDDESTYDIREVIDTETGDEIDAITLGQRLAAEHGYRYVTEWNPIAESTVRPRAV